MPLSKEEFNEACELICPLCRSGATLRFREATKEFVHDANSMHSICWASGLRNSRFAEEAKNG